MLENPFLNGTDSTCVETILKWRQHILTVLEELKYYQIVFVKQIFKYYKFYALFECLITCA